MLPFETVKAEEIKNSGCRKKGEDISESTFEGVSQKSSKKASEGDSQELTKRTSKERRGQVLYYNGIVYSLSSPEETPQEALLTEGNRILAIGREKELRSIAKENAAFVDLKGGCVLPGFNDSHCHLLHTAVLEGKLDVSLAASPEEILQMGRAYIEEKRIPEGAWVHIVGFDQNRFSKPVLPDGALAQAVSSRHPVLLERICGHVGAANPLALELAGITPETQIPGGAADIAADGSLTGVLRENALGMVGACIPKPSREELKDLLAEASERASALGLTSVQSDDLGYASLEMLFAACQELEEEGKLALRIWEEAQAPDLDALEKVLTAGYRAGDGGLFKLGNIKLYTDGSLGAQTAYMREPYVGSGDRGISVYKQKELNELARLAHMSGMQVAFHAIGDGALAQCLEAVEKAQKASPKKLRHRIVHCQIAGDDLLHRIKQAEICADIQPPFVPSDAALVKPLLGEERERTSYRWKTMLDMGIPLGGGSDSPVESLSPLWGIQCAVTRKGKEEKVFSKGWKPEEKLSLYEALCLYTKGGAYLSFEEKEKGTLQPGMLADFVVLGQNIFQTPPEEISQIPIRMTVMDGIPRYDRL